MDAFRTYNGAPSGSQEKKLSRVTQRERICACNTWGTGQNESHATFAQAFAVEWKLSPLRHVDMVRAPL